MSDLIIPLGRTGTNAVIDAADADLVLPHRWTRRKKLDYWYAIQVNGCCGYGHPTRFLHNVILGMPYVDHVDGDGLNNRRSNLRPATTAENNQNRRAWGASRFKGVSRKGNRWVMSIRIDGRTRTSQHATEEEAAHAYDELARQVRGDFGRYNFPQPGERAAFQVAS